MQQSSNNYHVLIQKLDEFIRRFYLNQLLRGLIYAGTTILAYFLIINLLEHFLFLSTAGRKFLFYSFLLIGGGILYKLVLLPLFHYNRLGKVISHETAAEILGKHFNEVSDKLLNVLQLKKQADGQSELLLMASINQKIEHLKPVPFSTAIDLRENRKYLKYLLIPLLAFISVFLASPNLIKESSKRLIYNNTVFEKPAPFKFNIDNNELRAIQFEDFELVVSVSGNALPQDVYINAEGYAYKMTKKSASVFSYKFSNLQKDVNFFLAGNNFNSKGFTLHVVPKPAITGFDVLLDYPAYTGKQDETLKNIGDLTLPAGTKVQWQFYTKNTEQLLMSFSDSTQNNLQTNDKGFSFSRSFKQSSNYKIKVSGKEMPEGDSVLYAVNIIPDQYPTIFLEAFRDSVTNQYVYFSGEIADDYGISKLLLKYKIISSPEDEDKEDYLFEMVSFNRALRQSTFNHYWDLKKVNVQAGERLVYFFEVWDNDGVNGAKSTRSNNLSLHIPSEEEMEKITDKSNEQVKDKLAETMMQAADLKKELEQIKNKIVEKKGLEWEDKKSIEKTLEKQKALEDNLKDLQNELAKNNALQNEKGSRSDDIKQKQEKLQKMFDEMMSDEMKKLYEQLESMLDELNKKDALDKLEDFKLSEEELEKELDKMLSLFKQLELEQKMKDAISKLEKLSDEQNKLSEETKNAKQEEKESITQKQDDINKKFDDVKKEMGEMEKTAQELDMPADFSQTEQKSEEVSEQLNQSKQNISQNKNSKASESQKSAADKMKEMSEQMSAMMQDMQAEQMEEDMKAIRQLLENLITLSLDQEALMKEVLKTNINDPKYLVQIQKQRKIKDDTKMVEDSLFALSKRVFELESFINKEIREVNKNMSKSLENLEARQKSEAGKDQQYVMTGFNNLALMLSEAMEQMQQQMAESKPGSQMCQKPGQKPGQKKGKGMSQMQQQLNDQLDKLSKEMKSGKTPGKGEMSKGMAEMAQKQAAIREAMKKMMGEEGIGKCQGSGGSQLDQQKCEEENKLAEQIKKAMEQMDKTETELANKQLTEETIKRQQDIFTKLLEAEEALRKREKENKRESNTALDTERKLPPSLEEYLKKREAEIQLYKTVPPALNPYYKQLVEKYFKNINF
jgi:hypothetical protein